MSVIEFTPNGYPRFGGLRRDGPPPYPNLAWERLPGSVWRSGV